MTRPARTALLAAALAALTIGLGAPATPAHAQPGAANPIQSASTTRFNLEFPGGPVNQYLDAVRAASGYSNILLSGRSDLLNVPAASLKSITVMDAVALIESLPTDPDLRVEVDTRDSALVVRVEDRSPARARLQTESTVWSLADLISDQRSAEDILTAIEAGVAIVDGDADIRFHRETHLLIIRGTRSELEMAHQVLSEMRRAAAATNDAQRTRAAAAEAEALRHEMEQVAQLNIRRQREAEVAMLEAAEARDRAARMEDAISQERLHAMERVAAEKLDAQSRILELEHRVAELETRLRDALTALEERERQLKELRERK